MKENKLLNLSQEFALKVIKLANNLRDKKEHSFADQIKRSGTSISANIAEANYPQSRLDMISKFEIALKEANETENWLIILNNSNLVEKSIFELLHNKVIKIKILLITSIKTLKSKLN
ncbi:MAG: four helix bundle protein [Clostridiales bacterium]|nr:four helix bundle protein [Clostridiales bacterium]